MRRRNSEATRISILARTAKLLNTRGYLHTPLSEIMRVTNREKGGIYHHFESREDLALAAFQHSTKRLGARLLAEIGGDTTAKEKLLALIRFPLGEAYWRGGCPIANLAVESDDANPRLCAAARETMDWLLGLFVKVIEQGKRTGDFADVDAHFTAVRMIAVLEGAIVLSNLHKDPKYLRRVVDRLAAQTRAGLK